MQIILKTILLFSLGSCALFKEARVSSAPDVAKRRICLNSEGKGRFIFDGQKHVFSYQSLFSEDDLKWLSYIDFPVYGRETIELEWDSTKNRASSKASYEQALLKNSKGLNPALLDAATTMWRAFFKDYLIHKNLIGDKKTAIKWIVKDKELVGRFRVGKYIAEIKFLNVVSQGYFGRFDFKLHSSRKKELFGMELIVRNCLEKPEF
ncbi:MAG: hypothetical protein KC478_04240 [Bacteriovoracaceae bacterium]|nr:hypothetical protein [Bacteriovoracaceae bacterium]